MLNDLRYAFRTLHRAPGFAVTAILTLTLGIGANTAIFSVVNAVLLRPLPFPGADRLVQIASIDVRTNHGRLRATPLDFIDWRARTRSFERMGGHIGTGFAFSGEGEPELVIGHVVTEDVLPALGVPPALGRGFVREEFEPGNDRVLMLSDGLWRRRFGADRAAVGRTVTVNSTPYTIVGVMPPGFEYPNRRVQLWAPLVLRPTPGGLPFNRASHYLQVVARLKPGVTIAQAQGEMDSIAAALASQYPDTNGRLGAGVISLTDLIVGDVRPALWALVGAVGFLVLIACSNVTSLLLARATGRSREVAIRAALGGGAWRIARQFLVESVLLYALGGLFAVLFAAWGLTALIAASPGDIPRLDQTTLDTRVLAFTALVSLGAGVLFGLAPALQAARPKLADTLKTSARSTTGARGTHRLRAALVVGEVALSIVLLIGAGLAVRSFVRLMHVEAGFDVDEQLTFGVVMREARYKDAPSMIAFSHQAIDSLSAAPGVTAIGATTALPLSGQNIENGFTVEGRVAGPDDVAIGGMRGISGRYFAAMGIKVLRGRVFTASDTVTGAPVAIVTESFAARYFGGRDPLTVRVQENGSSEWRTVVGVTADVKHNGIGEETRPEVYLPYDQLDPSFMTTWARGIYVVLKGAVPPAALVALARDRVHAIDASIPLTGVQTLAALASDSVAQPRFRTVLLGLFAALALMLAMVGVFGVMSFFVAQRTQEIGIRIALGARRGDVIASVVGRGITLAVAGIALGALAAVPLMEWRKALLFEVEPTDPWTFAVAAVMMTGVAAAASYLPARRAANVSPMEALRAE